MPNYDSTVFLCVNLLTIFGVPANAYRYYTKKTIDTIISVYRARVTKREGKRNNEKQRHAILY